MIASKIKNVYLLLDLPCLYRAIVAKKTIDMFKNHFVTRIATVDSSFPLHLWCILLPLETAVLNLIKPSRINPKLPTHRLLNGIFDYKKTPLALLGYKVVVYENRN